MHGVRMIDYACNGGESRGERDNDTQKFNLHIQKRHTEQSQTSMQLTLNPDVLESGTTRENPLNETHSHI